MTNEKFSWQDGEIRLCICFYCKHLLQNARCKAFPSGNPDDILQGKFDHRKPFPGDGGITFESAVPHLDWSQVMLDGQDE